MKEVVHGVCLDDSLRPCLCTRCGRGGCTLRTDSLAKHRITIIDCDTYVSLRGFTKRLCDYLLFYDNAVLIVIAIELKGGRIHANEVIEQIRNGAKVAERFAKPENLCKFFPIVLFGRRTRSMEFRVLGRPHNKVAFRGERIRVYVGRCGSQLTDFIGS